MVNVVCLIIPSLRHGGAERVISILANEWSRRPNLKVFIILLTKQEHFYSVNDNVTIIEPQEEYTSNLISKFYYSIWILKFIRRTIRELKPDAVLSFCERYNNIVLLSLLGINVKRFVSDRNNPKNTLGLVHENLRKRLYKGADGIIAQTTTAKDILYIKTKNPNIKAIPNPLRNVEEHDVTKRENIILTVGRNVEQKNQRELIEIFSRLEDAEHWKLEIIGVGDLRHELENLVEMKGLSNRVSFLDFQKNIDFYFQRAKIFVFTSLYEGFPNALIEAMANGLPTVSYDCPTGPSELIVDGKNGDLVELNNTDLFVRKLQFLINDDMLRNSYGEEAKNVKTKYSSQQISQEYLNFILK
ncbi:LPS N-acetylglucosaminyltransferase [Sphingobacterium alkalisoli]|nr:LPS N-acetylglucosaminyltransferase [Sphingobacterium alkalisoli]